MTLSWQHFLFVLIFLLSNQLNVKIVPKAALYKAVDCKLHGDESKWKRVGGRGSQSFKVLVAMAAQHYYPPLNPCPSTSPPAEKVFIPIGAMIIVGIITSFWVLAETRFCNCRYTVSRMILSVLHPVPVIIFVTIHAQLHSMYLPEETIP